MKDYKKNILVPDIILLFGWAFVLLLPPFRYRIYACLNMSLSVPSEIIISIGFYLCVFSLLLFHTKLTKDSESIKMTCVVAFIALIFARFTSWSIGHGIENRIFYDRMEVSNGKVYTSYVIQYNANGGRVGPHAYVILSNRNRSTKKIHGKFSKGNTVLVSFPELPNEFEAYHYSIYDTECYEENPNDMQTEYCRNGVKMSNKIRKLKNTPTNEELTEFILRKKNHTIKVISAVVVKNSKNFIYFDVPQSDELLFAEKRSNSYSEQQKVLIAYDVDKIQAFYVCNSSPSDEEYEQYKTPTGLPLPPEYHIEAIKIGRK